MNGLIRSGEFDLLCQHIVENLVNYNITGRRGEVSVSIVEGWGYGRCSGDKVVYLKYCPYRYYFGLAHSPWYIHISQWDKPDGLTRQEREDALVSFELLFVMLHRFNIKITKIDVLGQKNENSLLRFLREGRSEREIEDEKEHLRRMDIERNRIFKGLPTLLETLMKDILVFNKRIKEIDERRYAKMCRGHLRVAEYDAALRETKSLTEKVLRYIPEVATFADRIASYDVALAESYYRICGDTIDDDYFHYRKVGHLDKGLSEFTHFYAGWYDTEDETVTEMVERTFNDFYRDKCKEIEDCIREEIGEEVEAAKSATVDEAVHVILDYAKEKGRERGAISYLAKILSISKDQFTKKYF